MYKQLPSMLSLHLINKFVFSWFQNFRDQRIDGAGLPLLTEEHLTTKMNMKLGPALKLRSILAKKIGSCSVCLHCTHCHTNNNSPEPSPSNVNSNTTTTTDSIGGNSWKSFKFYVKNWTRLLKIMW